MGYRMHIAIVNTQKAQPIRVTTGEQFDKIVADWAEVQKILCEACKKAQEEYKLSPTILQEVEAQLKENGLAYSHKMLEEKFWELSDGPFIPSNDAEIIIRNASTRFQLMVLEDMQAIEDYVVGCVDVPADVGYAFFCDEAAQRIFNDYNPRILRKQDMETIIESWRKLIVQQYKEILLDPTKELRWRGHLEAKLDRWEFPGSEPYNLENDSKEIVKAYDLEYRIFELVRLYKALDWMRDTVILYGW